MSSFSDYLFSNYEHELVKVDKCPDKYKQKRFRHKRRVLEYKLKNRNERNYKIQHLYGNYIVLNGDIMSIQFCRDIIISGYCNDLTITNCTGVSFDKLNIGHLRINYSHVKVPFYYKSPLNNISITYQYFYSIKNYYDSICYIYVSCTRLGINIDFNVLLLLYKFLGSPLEEMHFPSTNHHVFAPARFSGGLMQLIAYGEQDIYLRNWFRII
jgi:hypothetical protein